MLPEKKEKAKLKMVKVVLDTNILVSSLLATGSLATVIDLVANSRIIPYYNDSIFQEYWDVLSREKFGFNSLHITRLIHDIARSGIAVEYKQPSKQKMIDEDDRVFYDIALEAQAYLITGNVRHFPPDLFIVTPSRFLTIFLRNTTE